MEKAGTILSAIFDNSDDVWFFVAPDHRILFFNRKALENSTTLHGKEIQRGDSILDYVRDAKNNIDERFIQNFGKAKAGSIVKDIQHIAYESVSLWFSSKYVPVYDAGNLLGISITVEDITSQKETEEEQLRSREQIIQLSNKREEFINIASHELKTPLTNLKASFQIMHKKLKHGADFGEIEHFLDRSHVSINRLNTLIGDLLNVSKIDKGLLQLERSEFNLSKLINDCCSHVRIQGTHTIHVTGDSELTVFADSAKIDQVIVNLVNNAVTHATGSARIDITIQRITDATRISVRDYGPGIPKEKHDQLFSRYYQGEAKQGGMGLGLYIAEGIINQHGGEMGVESAPNEGSTFWFTIPDQPPYL